MNGLAVAKGDLVVYAASEWGGIFKSKDGGHTWIHLDAHLPGATWRVKVDPADSDRLYATSFYDGRVNSLSGINISDDGGLTWNHPTTAMPPPQFCKNPASQFEFSAFGISISPDDSNVVYVGTACGIAITSNHGVTWKFVNPSPTDTADSVWDVLAQRDGIVDACGDDGHSRSPNSGEKWTPTNSLPSGRCSLTASPDEPGVLFSVVGTQPYESDDAGMHWSTLENPFPQGRIPFVRTNKRSDSAFDLWFGDVTLYRIPCATPQNGVLNKNSRCPAVENGNWMGPFTRKAGGHDDTADIVFSTGGSEDQCPLLFASDGGVYLNTLLNSPGCHDPKWRQPDVSPHGLWLLALDGAPKVNSRDEDLYIGNQDDGTFGTRTALAQHPLWTNTDCCDSPLLSASPSRILYASCCYEKPYRFNQLYVRDPGLIGGGEIAYYPPGDIPGWEPRILTQFATNMYAVITTAGIFTTPDISLKPIAWNGLGTASAPASGCGIYASTPKAGAAVFFLQVKNCDGRGGSVIYRLEGTGAKATWQALHKPDTNGTFGVFAVDAHNPLRLIGSYLNGTEPYVAMVSSDDGGKTWNHNAALDKLMTQNGTFKYLTTIGPTDSTTFAGYPQPTLVAFDPDDENVIVAAGTDSGLFLSVDMGNHWEEVLLNGRSMYRARAVRFSHSKDNGRSIFAGSEGAGVWRIRLGQ